MGRASWHEDGARPARVPIRAAADTVAQSKLALDLSMPTSRRPMTPPRFERPALGKIAERKIPRDDAFCGWIESLAPPTTPPRQLTGRLSAEVVVLGAGFTGLAAARRWAELRPGASVVLLEAQRAGYGTSGRSSGFLVDLAHFIARMRPDHADAYVRVARHGIAQLRQQMETHGIACDWDDRGWIHAAHGEAAARELPHLAAWLEARNEPYESLDRDALTHLLGTPYYRAGLRLPGSVMVQAAALARGLVAHLPPTVELFEETPALSIRRARGGWDLETPSGSVHTENLLLATNAYTPNLGALGRRLFPLWTFGSLTRPLTLDEQATLGSESEWGVLAEDALGSTLRRTRDQRLLIRNGLTFDRNPRREPPPEKIRAAHEQALAARYPHLAGIELDWTWGGALGTTPSRNLIFGELDRGLWAAAAYTGAGIALGTAAGALLSELALGEPSERSDRLGDLLALPRPAKLPPRPFLDWGIRWQVARMNRNAGPVV